MTRITESCVRKCLVGDGVGMVCTILILCLIIVCTAITAEVTVDYAGRPGDGVSAVA